MHGAAASRALSLVPIPSTAAAWNAAIREAVDGGRRREALHLYLRMRRACFPPDNLTFPFVVKACASFSDERTAQAVHAHVAKSPFGRDVFVQTSLVDVYVKQGFIGCACNLFDEMPQRDAAAWNVLMTGFSQMGCLKRMTETDVMAYDVLVTWFSQLGCLQRMLVLFRRMRMEELVPDSVTVILLSQACALDKSLQVARFVHCLGIRLGVAADVTVANTWISTYSKCGDLGSAELVFGKITLGGRTIVSWNSLISGYAHLGRLVEAIACFREMCQNDIMPDLSTTVSLLSLFAHSAALSEGKMVHSLAIRQGFDLDSCVGNTLISLYSKCGEIDVARFCFDSMPRKTSISWTVMIDGYALQGDVNKAMNLFHAMQDAGEKPDCVTIVAVLSACGQAGAIELGRLMNQFAVANGLDEEIMVCNALLDMYMKCGSGTEAQRLFEKMHERTIVSWTTMISGYAMNGNFTEALRLFSQMVKSGMEPNHITFLAVLQACTHAGFLEKGWEYFHMMTDMYRIDPGIEHYACIVDLLGRKGKVKQAFEFVKNMPIEPDAGVWGALLGACITHCEIGIGEYAAHQLFELEPQTAASYVSMANIYASKGRWDGVGKMRCTMREKGTRKSPGQSSIHVNGQIHTFSVQDRHHLEIFRIYEVLHGLSSVMKKADLDLGSVVTCELG